MALVPQRILLVDDDLRLSQMLIEYLRGNGFDVEHREDGNGGLHALEHGRFDAAILDVMLPDIDGFEVCRRARATSTIPILMLTARGDATDRIVGLELGADDYLPKPFNPRELLARLRAILRRKTAQVDKSSEPELLRFGTLEIDRGARTVRKDGELKELTSHQFELLWLLASRAGRVQSREQIMQGVRGEAFDELDRSIDVHISRIRAAVEDDPKRPRLLKTVRSVGYVFTPVRENGS